MVSPEIDLKVKVFILANEVDKLLRLKEVSHTCGGTAKVTEVKPDVLKLMYASANHYYIINYNRR